MMSGFLLQALTVISGMIIPRLMLDYFGSEVNGLVTSIVQFLSYISLVEGGVTSVVMANLYKPVVENDTLRLNSVLNTARQFFRKIGLIFICYSFALAVIYPVFINKSFSFWYVAVLVVILSVGAVIQYMFSLTMRVLLDANKRSYIISLTNCAIIIVNLILINISVRVYPSIHVLKLISGLLYLIQPVVYGRYISRHYKIDKTAPVDNGLIKERWNGFAINLAAFIHGSTDVVILTFFTDLSTVSVYGVYALVTSGLKLLINATTSGIVPVVGQAYAKGDKKEINTKLDLYEYIIFMLVFAAYTLSCLLITPFVLLYTKGIEDADYNQLLFGILLCVAEAVYLIKAPHLNLAYTANKFKEISLPAYIEAAINIVVSIALVGKFGLVGVAVGTICAMAFRTAFHIYYTKKILGDRKQWIFYKKLLLFLVATAIGVFFCICIPLTPDTIIKWIACGVIYAVILIVIYAVLSILFFKKEVRYLINYLKK